MHRLLGGLLLFLTAILFAAQPAAAQPSMNWGEPYPVAPGFGPHLLGARDISCPTEDLCVAVGGRGNALISTDPTGGAGAWDVVHIDSAGDQLDIDLQGISCVGTSFCVAVDSGGNVITSTDPAAGAAAWTARTVDAGHHLADVSCPSVALCVAVDEDGRTLASTEPLTGAWKVTTVDAEASLRGVTCPTASFCAAAGMVAPINAEVFTVVNPGAAAPNWEAAGLDVREGEADRLICPSPSLCLLPGEGKTLVSTSPGNGASWESLGLGSMVLACPSASLCVALRYDGSYLISDDPASEASWRQFPTAEEHWIESNAIACAGSSFCVAGLNGGDVFVLADPEGESPAWVRAATGSSYPNALNAVSCPSASLCLASSPSGDLYATADPGAPEPWSGSHLVDGELRAVTCSSPSWCVALGKTEATGELLLLYSEEPDAGAGAWHSVDRPKGANVSCPSPSFCALVRAGEVVTSTEPLGGASTWTATKLDLPERLTGLGMLPAVSCPSSDFCAVGGEGGYVLSSDEPTGGAGAWVKAFVGYAPDYYHWKGPNVEDVECRSASLCAAVTWGSAISIATEPLGGSPAWTVNGRPELYIPLAVSCAGDASLCVVGTRAGDAVTSFAPTQPGSPWGESAVIDTYDDLADLECDPTGAVCVAVDQSGFATVGTPEEGTPEKPGGEEPGDEGEEPGQGEGPSGGGQGGPPGPPGEPGKPGARHCKHRHSGGKASKGHRRHGGKRIGAGKGPKGVCARHR